MIREPGDCLMMGIVRNQGVLKEGLKTYVKRRAIRIIPPYYAAIAVSLAITAVLETTLVKGPPNWSDFQPDLLISHLLLIHNFHHDWIHAIDPPMWSVAVEWQIYFLLPLVLLPFTVGGTDGAADLFGLFDDTVSRLLAVLGKSPAR